MQRASFFFISSCSHILRTHHPLERSLRVTNRSRTVLADSFCCQNARLLTGRFECFGQLCQKQPSTKMTTRSFGKVKSGLPKVGRCRRHPLMPAAWSNFASAISVSLLPRERMRDITSERLAFVKTSDTGLDTPYVLSLDANDFYEVSC